MSDELEFLRGLVSAAVRVVVIATVLGVIVSIGLAPEPGDPLYMAWLDLTHYGETAILLAVPSAGSALLVLHKTWNDSSGR